MGTKGISVNRTMIDGKKAKKKLKARHLVQAAMDRLIPDPDGQGVKKADVIIEAIFENLEAKQKLFKKLEAQDNIIVYSLIQKNKRVLDEFDTRSNITKYLDHLNSMVGYYHFDLRGFKISD